MGDKKRYKDKIGSWTIYVGTRGNTSSGIFLPVKVILADSSKFCCYCCCLFCVVCVCVCVLFFWEAYWVTVK